MRELVWKPLETQLAGCNTILLSPDSKLSQIPWGALPGKQPGSYLIEDVAVAVLPVPQLLPELLAARTEDGDTEPVPSLLIVGNIDYDAAVNKSADFSARQVSGAKQGGDLLTFEKLKSATAEISSLRALYSRQFPGGHLQVLEKSAATEAAFCRDAPQFRSLLIATHGFYAPPNLRAMLAVQDELVGLDRNHGGNRSGALSGLALAGANLPAEPGDDDGILTAEEAATLDLRKVDLAVLSGCETALGENALGEGALGLQRAFQVAGAHTTVASLWSVPDQKTSQLMERFYTNLWNQKLSRLEALREAQIWLMHSLGNEPTADRQALHRPDRLAPYSWGAFILSGDWR